MRLVRTKREIRISDTKTLPKNALGRVEAVIVKGHSIQAYFGCGFGSLSMAEDDIVDVEESEIKDLS